MLSDGSEFKAATFWDLLIRVTVISKIKVLLQVHTHTRYLAEYRVTGFIYFKTSEALWPKHT